MRAASFLVVPSIWYEPFGLVVIEAFAAGLPVVAAGHGALAELVEDGRTGRHVAPGDPDHLAAIVGGLARDPGRLADLRRHARAEFEEKYGAARNHALLMRCYARALDRARWSSRGAAPLPREARPWTP
jgi:glycosyltransferase involved in cell wall biosynthesis